MAVSTVVTVVSLPIYWGLCNAFGAMGLAGGTSVGMILTALATLLALRWRGVAIEWGDLLRTLARGLAVAGLGAPLLLGAYWLVQHRVDWRSPTHSLLLLAASAALFGLLVLALARPLKLGGVLLLLEKVQRKLGRGQRTAPAKQEV
jgi:hypothetical protein